MIRTTQPRNHRFASWMIVAGLLATAVAGIEPGQDKPARKTTDPPIAARGKLGQDLFLAIDHRDLARVESLIKNGADPNARNGLEFTPLYIAAASHQADVMQSLLSAGSEADAESPYGSPLTFAAMTANAQGADLLYAHGVNVDTARGDGDTVLMMASISGYPPFVAELLKRKADVNAKSGDDSTALLYAARAGNLEVGKMLVAAGASVDDADAYGQTPLMAAAQNGHADFVGMLLDNGAKPNTRDGSKRTALILAASYGDYPEVIRALVKGGADVKATDAKGRTAGTCAAVHGYTQTAAVLGNRAPTSKIGDPRKAILISLKTLQSSMAEFARDTNCVSCHQEGLGRITTGMARGRGFPTDAAVRKIQALRVDGALNAMKPLHEQALKNPEVMKQVPLIEINEVNSTDTWLLAGRAAQKEPPNAASAAMALVLARQQTPNGSWTFSLPRVPMQSSVFTFTALAVRALEAYAPKSHAKETAAQIGRAKGWLLGTPAQTCDDRAFRLLGLKWAGASSAQRRKALQEVLAAQLPDGGWAQIAGLHSDAYATGQALYALHEGGGIAVSSPVYKRGVKFLLRTQDDDGSWYVNKRAIPANNYFDAGFPHGESQFASFNGTCWATMALLETVGRQ